MRIPFDRRAEVADRYGPESLPIFDAIFDAMADGIVPTIWAIARKTRLSAMVVRRIIETVSEKEGLDEPPILKRPHFVGGDQDSEIANCLVYYFVNGHTPDPGLVSGVLDLRPSQVAESFRRLAQNRVFLSAVQSYAESLASDNAAAGE